MSAQPILILVTAPTLDVARTLAMGLVQNNLVACVNLVPGVESIYRWEGKIQQEAEILMLCKSTSQAWLHLQDWLAQNHPYSVPEMLVLSVDQGASPYLAWLQNAVLPEGA